jgi:hypothetical protein
VQESIAVEIPTCRRAEQSVLISPIKNARISGLTICALSRYFVEM